MSTNFDPLTGAIYNPRGSSPVNRLITCPTESHTFRAVTSNTHMLYYYFYEQIVYHVSWAESD